MPFKYEPEQASEVTPQYLQRELRRIAEAFADHYEVSYVEPTRPRAGDIVYADGVEWNPGSGEGLYRYNLAGSWAFVG